ncbi:hypothetical protein [Chlamydiifrater phoenicopteri]|uniref:hypothetical protein n=1 Tax=Chlamydiifrater phoenicopteri TaxID=2681469 RepID=UPI001BCFB202|nr:hypothetical protein [Chlamydiifrater phoenicopteri]
MVVPSVVENKESLGINRRETEVRSAPVFRIRELVLGIIICLVTTVPLFLFEVMGSSLTFSHYLLGLSIVSIVSFVALCAGMFFVYKRAFKEDVLWKRIGALQEMSKERSIKKREREEIVVEERKHPDKEVIVEEVESPFLSESSRDILTALFGKQDSDGQLFMDFARYILKENISLKKRSVSSLKKGR